MSENYPTKAEKAAAAAIAAAAAAVKAEKAAAEAEALKAGTAVRLVSPFAFYDDDGALKTWPAGAVVVEPDEIAILTSRGAPVEKIG